MTAAGAPTPRQLAELERVVAVLRSVDAARPGRAPLPHAEEILARYDEVDARLVAKGFPPTSAWWRSTFERWYRSGARWLVPRVGRRGGKSSSLSRLAVVEMLYGDHEVPPGDVGTVAVISTDRSEAIGRLQTIKEILDALGVAWKPLSAPRLGIELPGRRRNVRVFAASIAGVSGFTAVFVLCDEVAKWKDNDAGVNPATEVIASVRPTMATQVNARGVLSSSPMGKLDAHYDAFERGDGPAQVVAHAPTWVANPTITEAQTRADEPDEATHSREYGAVPQAQEEHALLTDLLIERGTRAHGGQIGAERGHYYVATMDPATRGNAWTLAVATRGADDKRKVVYTREWIGTPAKPLSPKAVFREIAADLAGYGLQTAYTDQWAIDSLREHATDAGLALLEEPWTPQSKGEAYEGLLKLAQANLLDLPRVPAVKQDLLGIRKKLTRNGFVYELATVGARHSDFAPTIAMAALKAEVRPTADPLEAHRDEKREFLVGLTRDRHREDRFGRLPATHRRPR